MPAWPCVVTAQACQSPCSSIERTPRDTERERGRETYSVLVAWSYKAVIVRILFASTEHTTQSLYYYKQVRSMILELMHSPSRPPLTVAPNPHEVGRECGHSAEPRWPTPQVDFNPTQFWTSFFHVSWPYPCENSRLYCLRNQPRQRPVLDVWG